MVFSNVLQKSSESSPEANSIPCALAAVEIMENKFDEDATFLVDFYAKFQLRKNLKFLSHIRELRISTEYFENIHKLQFELDKCPSSPRTYFTFWKIVIIKQSCCNICISIGIIFIEIGIDDLTFPHNELQSTW